MSLKNLSALILGIFFSISIVFSQNLNKPKLDSLFTLLSQKNKAMGSIAISSKGTIVYQKSIGYSDYDKKQEATPKTKYRIGSISKMFTTVIIFQLIEEGKLSLETKLNTYFPQIPNSSQITVGNMLNHRSGIHSFTSDADYRNYMTNPKTPEELVSIIAKSKADFKPNEKAAYSNSNFVLLGYIVEKVEGKPFHKVLKERITSKIGLENTYVGEKTSLETGESYSYSYLNTWIKQPETDMSIPGGAGAIVSTPQDLTKFIESLFAGKLISKGNLELMKTVTEGHGMGMFQIPFGTKKAYGHNGGIDGFVSNLSYFPEESVAVAYCSNGNAYNFNDILIGVLSIYFNKDYKLPTFSTLSLKTEDLDKYLGEYSSTDIPIKITITKKDSVLYGQGTGQPVFPLEATGQDEFKFDPAGIVMEFYPAKNEMLLKQGGKTYTFKR
jgi:CubicO group peptidase (beta-lactamase class C family)